MALNDEGLRPACGASLAAIVRQGFEDAPPADPLHQAGCEHCRRSLAAVRALKADMDRFAAEPVAVPDVAGQVLARLRRDWTRVPVAAGARGATTVTHSIVGDVARRAAMALPAVTFASVEVVTPAGEPAALTVRLIVGYGPALEAVADAARELVARAVEELVGVRVGRVDVLVEDLS